MAFPKSVGKERFVHIVKAVCIQSHFPQQLHDAFNGLRVPLPPTE
jgi:hypothetical protein